jgi:outer membrane protein insertion porin family
MSGVKDGTFCGSRVAPVARWGRVLLFGLAWSLSLSAGCQSMPKIRGQSPAFDEPPTGESARRIRRITDEPSPEEESIPRAFEDGSSLEGEDKETLSDPITEIVIEGNDTIETTAIRKLVRSAVGRPPTESQIREDVRALYSTRWFFSVEPRYRRNVTGLVLVFRVIERPMVEKVEFRGNDRIKTAYLEKLTGLKAGSPFDVSVNREAVKRIEEQYQSKGFPYTKVSLEKGNRREDRQVIFVIDEGPKVIVGAVKFEGNDSFGYGILKQKLTLKPAILGLPFLGKYKPEQIPDDVSALKQYYHSLGYFDVEIEKEVGIDESPWNPLSYKVAHAIITYRIKEGPRFKIRDLIIEGNQIFSKDELAANLKLRSGDFYNARHMTKDVDGIKERYGALGRTFANAEPVPRFLDEPGTMDLVYQINEDRVYTIRHVDVRIHEDQPHTKLSVVLNRMMVHPGDLADPKKIRQSERRIGGQIFTPSGPDAPRIQISKVPDKPNPNRSQVAQASVIRGQSPEPATVSLEHLKADSVLFGTKPSIRGQSPEESAADPDGYGSSMLMAQTPPPQYPFGGSTTDPLAVPELPPGQIDLGVDATTAQTGRLSFGVGVNSNSGVVGSIVLEENNFDIWNFPRSAEDIYSGRAFRKLRGHGEQFRLEAVPGNIVSRYLVSWTDPYFNDGPFSVGVSGFYFNRFYRDWTEQRMGGRITVGHQLDDQWSIIGSLRMESVHLSNPTRDALGVIAPLLRESLGNSFLSTGRIAIAHDTRDSPFQPRSGHYVTAGFEQAFGEFSYSRVDAEGHQYFYFFERPDGDGGHILSLGLQSAWTGADTPIYERYFAGGFQSMRGFQYRGISPIDHRTRIGGQFLFLGGAEYLIPITADGTLGMVGFTDFGTIQNDKASLQDFRVTAGFGLRVTVPLMGPAPIALDFGFPLTKQADDLTQVFQFTMGITR